MSYEEFEALTARRGIASGIRGLQTFQELAILLEISLEEVEAIATYNESHYEIYRQPKASGGFRLIEKPNVALKAIQRKLKQKLSLEPLPIFLSMPAKGRSNITNAMVHRDRKKIVCLDIKNHFQNCKSRNVFQLFYQVMECSEEVALLLTNLSCLQDHLPTGAPTSPLLAFLAYEKMFHWLYDLAGDYWCRLSVFADDLTISWRFDDGESGTFLDNFKRVVEDFGFSINSRKTKKYNQNRAAEITGTIVMPDGELRMPNRLHRQLFELRTAYKQAEGEEKQRLKAKLKGLEQYLQQIERIDRRPIRRGNTRGM